MGISMLGGIVGDIVSAITWPIRAVLELVINEVLLPLLIPILQQVITALIYVIKYTLAGIFYEISVFLLQLIDFVQMLFRSLAGLGGSTAGMSLTMNVKDSAVKRGDLIIQFLFSEPVVEAFWALCIVGVFLLIITTIFQMIKVEYTTEGANNSKSSIISKSVKSLANLVLIPVLVVFGVIIGNQILDLIDTATSGDGATISGSLFVAAASNAMYNDENSNKKDNIVKNQAYVIGDGIALGLKLGFSEAERDKFLMRCQGSHSDRINIEANVANQDKDYMYSDVTKISKYYCVYEINYLILIFGACLIIKSLYHVCFGMIDRLYQCVVLFVVSPLVIGMTPVKDSLASWRSKFISKALSAYGYIISLNLFLIIVKVMLSIEFHWSGLEKSSLNFLGETFLSGLLKSLMVIVGCLMIEKLAPDLGSYFGGGDAAGTGKGLASEATAGLAKAATIAGTVAMGAGGLAVKGIKAGAGIAGKLGGGIDRLTGGRIGDGINSVKKKFKDSAIGQKVGKGVQKTKEFAKDAKEWTKAKAKSAGNYINDLRAGVWGGSKAEQELAFEQAELARLEKAKAIGAQGVTDDTINHQKERIIKAQEKVDKNNKRRENLRKHDEEVKEKVKTTAKTVRENVAVATETVGQMAKKKFTVKNSLDAMGVPKSVTGLSSEYASAQKELASTSPEFQSIIESRAKVKSDAAKDRIEGRHKGMLNARAAAVTGIIADASIQKLQQVQDEQNRQLDKLNQALNKAVDRMTDKNASQESRNLASQQVYGIQNQMQSLNKNITFGDSGRVEQINNLHLDLDTNAFKKHIEDAIKKGSSKDELDKIIADQLKKWGQEGNAEILKELHKVLEEIKGMSK